MSALLNKHNTVGLFALLLLVVVVAFVVYWRTSVEGTPGDYQVKQGHYRLEDGQYNRALDAFQQALARNSHHALAYLGLALAYMHLQQYDASLDAFDQTLALDPSLAVAYADRGILNDKIGKHTLALRDYRKALELDPKLANGPGWLWRFLRNVPEAPPTIADRAAYLELELDKPPEERLLQMPTVDQQQRMYKY